MCFLSRRDGALTHGHRTTFSSEQGDSCDKRHLSTMVKT
jgi:hypothetical protein